MKKITIIKAEDVVEHIAKVFNVPKEKVHIRILYPCISIVGNDEPTFQIEVEKRD